MYERHLSWPNMALFSFEIILKSLQAGPKPKNPSREKIPIF
jgi:hypothetical protein